MSKKSRRVVCALLLAAQLPGSTWDPVGGYWHRRFGADSVAVNSVAGLNERIENGKLHLTLRLFLELLLKNSPDVQLARLDIYSSATQITAARAPFDPAFGLGFSAQRSVSPLLFASGASTGTGSSSNGTGSSSTSGSTPSSGSGSTGSTASVGFPQTIDSLTQNSFLNYSQVLPTGQTISANYTGYRFSGNSYDAPLTEGFLSFTLTQPLWQNRTNLQYRGPVEVAKRLLLITSEQSRATIAAALSVAARQYWDAVLERDLIAVNQQNLDLATKSYDRDKLALQLGALAKLDIFQSQTQVAERNRSLIEAQFTYRAQLDALRRFIGADITPAFRNTELVLDDDPSVLPPKSSILPFEAALAKALAERPESKVASGNLAVDELNARIARDALRPRVDLSALGGANGPGLTQLGTGGGVGVTPAIYPGIGPTLRQILAFDYPSYGFSLQVTFPFRNSTAQANLANSLVQKAKDQYTQRQTAQGITNDVRQSLDALELANASVNAALTARDLAQKNVTAEQQKYELGSITAFELLDSQSRLASSQSALSNAYVTYQEAFVNYRRATWTLLDDFGMVVQVPKVH